MQRTLPIGWHRRRYHPHFENTDVIQSITFRLAAILPKTAEREWEEQLRRVQSKHRKWQHFVEIEQLLKGANGEAWLRQPEIAQIVDESIRHYDGKVYRLHAWCVMPTHVHLLAEFPEGMPMSDAIRRLKGYTARKSNELLGRKGAFWARDYFDRYIRNANHYLQARAYIEQNPVKAKLCEVPEDWPFGSARLIRRNSPG